LDELFDYPFENAASDRGIIQFLVR
jgi:hypothetical protein